MDANKASWILEFILRGQMDQSLVKAALRSLPNPVVTPRLMKTLTFHVVGSDLAERSISENTLKYLELLEELDRAEGKTVPKSLKQAYCAVAVECTLRPLREGSTTDTRSFLDAVNRIWGRRIAGLEQSEVAGLFSEQLMAARIEIGEAVLHFERKRILHRYTNAKREAIVSVREYLREAMREMGPPLLELAAEAIVREGKVSRDGFRPSGEYGVPGLQRPTDGASPLDLGCPASDPNRGTEAPVGGMEKQLEILLLEREATGN